MGSHLHERIQAPHPYVYIFGSEAWSLGHLIEFIPHGYLKAKYGAMETKKAMLANNKVVCLPHLGASTPEAEDNCAKMAVKQVMAFMEEGTR